MLDRAVVNLVWLACFPSSSVNFSTTGIFHHSPIMVSIFDDVFRRPKFSFLNCWLEDPDYSRLVVEAWRVPVSGTAMYRLFAKLKNVRASLRGLHKKSYSNIDGRLRQAKGDLEDCQRQLQIDPLNSRLICLEKLKTEQYLKLRKIEHTILRQKAKFRNIVHNDSCSKVFYARINDRKHTQIIGEIMDHLGRRRVGLDSVAGAGFRRLLH
ncbi:hypothetical protein RND81_05G029400 [Saponaria officinalis]|uniref:Uncharacterized protein n=1 Tax=Saponaria officinalis TaxID=3572 RepID=A0AAW1KWX9_SAPOF